MPLDFIKRSNLKTIVFGDTAINLRNLKNKITTACNELTDKHISIAIKNKDLMRRAKLCFVHVGH